MRIVVVGAGAWGLPAAAELQARGHEVTLVDRYGVGNALSSSSGPTRLWRFADPDPVKVRLARRGLEAMERLALRSGTRTFIRRGLLWRDEAGLDRLVGTLDAEGVAYTAVDASDVGRFFDGLRPDGRNAVWAPDGGSVLAADSLSAQAGLFAADGGSPDVGRTVTAVERTPHGPRVVFTEGPPRDADVVVLAAGPGSGPLLAGLGVDVPLLPVLEQVVHVGDPARPHLTDELPGFIDAPRGDEPGIYAMPTPGIGYKIGIDAAIRDWALDDLDRTPSAERTRETIDRVVRDFPGITPHAIDAAVCSWTASSDGRFVVDRLDGDVVIACGDSGSGFKFSAVMGLILADLAEGVPVDDDVASLGLARFDGVPPRAIPRSLFDV
ncbi:NAD(P)/FAD-dependent oxidoreductase [Labedella endophytica]|uniref:FAD-dependent oxidoreductase n=1 Tax=Labedella endophytica TaxID=1523160 RepID=A0A3S1CSR2_9MICO|nr:FAD-dependent oxidoreductase [Labedella endophytica]RUR01626.1 FAD-dependent oxidoreductase [Labedella endophytica]